MNVSRFRDLHREPNIYRRYDTERVYDEQHDHITYVLGCILEDTPTLTPQSPSNRVPDRDSGDHRPKHNPPRRVRSQVIYRQFLSSTELESIRLQLTFVGGTSP